MLEIIDGRQSPTPIHISRPRSLGSEDPRDAVVRILDDVRLRGDAAVIEHTERLDGVRLTAEQLRVPGDDIAKARSLVRPELIDALEVMAERLRSTCERQIPQGWVARGPDDMVGEVIRPLRRVGIYAPGGRASYPSTVIMAAIPAQVAGVEGVAVCTPPGPAGDVNEAVMAACSVAGVTELYRAGGAQGIAALAYGTDSVRPVDKIVGPGNVYVTLAKRLVQGWVGIDSEAGPTELAIIADDGAAPRVVAADLVAQAEHGPLGIHVLITPSEELAAAVNAALELEVLAHDRSEDVENALIEGGRVALVRDIDHAIDTANSLAPEHLQLVFTGAEDALERIRNAGSVFLGPFSPVPVGDYVGGTNHVLPSGGTARWAQGLSVRDFVKHIYVSSYERSALERLAPHVAALAEAEGLPAHSRAVELRLKDG
jgi:histidinol dehydrogenase